MPVDLNECPSCGAQSVRIFEKLTTFNPDYLDYGMAEDNCMLKDVFQMEKISRSLLRCPSCCLHFISPTFSADEISRLYGTAKMSDHYKKVGSGLSSSPAANIGSPEITWHKEEPHSRFIFEALSKFRMAIPSDVVADIGGSYGYHCRNFLEKGILCYVQDYMQAPKLYPGVKYIQDISTIQKINFGICTHVLEHVVNLSAFVQAVSDKQTPGDMLYVEVPYELDSRLRNKNFGVPFHINFFSPEALNNLMAGANYQSMITKIRRLTYGGMPILSIYSVFKKIIPRKITTKVAPSNTGEILRGGIYRIINRFSPKLIQF